MYNEESDGYKIHRIITDVVKLSLGLEEESVAFLMERITSKLEIDQTKDNPIDKFKWIPFGKIMLERFEDSMSEEIGGLQNNLGITLEFQGDYTGAKELQEKAVESAERNYGSDHPTTAIRYSNLGTVLQGLKDYAGAKKLLEKAYKIFQATLGEDHPHTKTVKRNLDGVKNKSEEE